MKFKKPTLLDNILADFFPEQPNSEPAELEAVQLAAVQVASEGASSQDTLADDAMSVTCETATHKPQRSDETAGREATDLEAFHIESVDIEAVDIKPEPALIAEAKVNPQAFGALYERYVDRIFAYIYHRVGNTQDSEDLTARTFYKALDKLHSYEDRGFPFSAWLFSIARNLVANWHRDHGRRRFLSLDRLWSYSNDSETPDRQLERAERDGALWSAINRLPEERRDIVIYKFSSRLSNVEIGNIMDKSEGAIKSLYFRTLAALRKDLESREW